MIDYMYVCEITELCIDGLHGTKRFMRLSLSRGKVGDILIL